MWTVILGKKATKVSMYIEFFFCILFVETNLKTVFTCTISWRSSSLTITKCLRNIFDALPFVYCLCHLVTCMEDLEIQSVSTILPDKPRDQVDTHVD